MITNGRVVDYIVDHLAATGVEFLFGVDGANIEDLYDAPTMPRIGSRRWWPNTNSPPPPWPTAMPDPPRGSAWYAPPPVVEQ